MNKERFGLDVPIPIVSINNVKWPRGRRRVSPAFLQRGAYLASVSNPSFPGFLCLSVSSPQHTAQLYRVTHLIDENLPLTYFLVPTVPSQI